MPLISTLAAASARGFGEFSQQGAPNYIEDFFSTTLYDGTGVAQNIPTGIQNFTTASWATYQLAASAGTPLAQSVVTDSSNNVYVFGEVYTTGYYTFLAKYDTTGALVWQKYIIAPRAYISASTRGNYIAIDSGNNVYVVTQDINNGTQMILWKFDSSGNVVWQRVITGSGSINSMRCVFIDSSDNVYLGGVLVGAALVVKFNSSGTILWYVDLYNYDPTTPGGGSINALYVDSSGNVYATGDMQNAGGGLSRGFTIKLNSSGTLLWQRTYTDSVSSAYGNSICTDSSGNVYVGYRSPEVLVKYNSSGTVQWQKTFTSTYTSVGNIFRLIPTATGMFFAAKNAHFGFMDYDANIQWAVSTTNPQVYGIAIDNIGNFYICGQQQISTNYYIYVSQLKQNGTAKNGTAYFTITQETISTSNASYSSATASTVDAPGTLGSSASSNSVTTGALTASTATQVSASSLGSLVWIKSRTNAVDHALYDTSRGIYNDIASNLTSGQSYDSTGLTNFLTNSVNIGTLAKINTYPNNYATWTFRRQPKFFDIVTYSGNGANRTITHSLGSVPGMILIKRYDAGNANPWAVYHQSLANTEYLVLNTTAAKATDATYWNSTTPTSTVFSVGTNASVNASGGTYVAYLFASDAGGFGLNGNSNVVSCGTFTTDVSGNASVSLGYEPQFVIVKSVSQASNWIMQDIFGNFTNSTSGSWLYPNTTNAELSSSSILRPTATGFVSEQGNLLGSTTYVYMAIRRGPMAVPTTGTSVFQPTVYTGTNANNRLISTTIAPDLAWIRQRNSTTIGGMVVGDRLRGQPYLLTGTTAAEVTSATAFDRQLVSAVEYGNAFSSMSGVWVGNDVTAQLNVSTVSGNQIIEAFKRAPGFFDAVAYTGTGSNTTISHNLGAVPELMLIKQRGSTTAWAVYSSGIANTEYLVLNTTAAKATGATYWNSTTPTSTVFSVGTSTDVNASAATYMAYLFATCPGVSKVGTYTGTGTTLQVNCGFTAGARLVLIKRTDTTGDWFIYDTARGIVAANDPYILLNSTAAEVTTTDYVDPYSLGFELSSTAPAGLNANGGTYIYLAIA